MTIKPFSNNELSVLALVGSDVAYRPASVNELTLRSYPDSRNPEDVEGFPLPLEVSLRGTANALLHYRYEQIVGSDDQEITFDGWVRVTKLGDDGTGFGCSLFRSLEKSPTGKYQFVLAMEGTNGPDGRDWFQNIDLAKGAWIAKREQVFQLLSVSIPTLNGTVIPAESDIHFVGQSLGGALAQYAAYDFVVARKGLDRFAGSELLPGVSTYPFGPSQISLTTFNSFAAGKGLHDAYPGTGGTHRFDPNLLAGVQTRHYAISNDLVHRFGAYFENGKLLYGHLNGSMNNNVLLDFRRMEPAGGASVEVIGEQNYLDFFDSHRIEAGFYRGFKNYGGDFNGIPAYVGPTASGPRPMVHLTDNFQYLDLGNIQNVSTFFSRIASDGSTFSEVTATMRIAIGVVGAMLFGSSKENTALARTVIESGYKSGNVNKVVYELANVLPLGFIAKGIAAAFTATQPIGVAGLLSGLVFDFLKGSSSKQQIDAGQRLTQALLPPSGTSNAPQRQFAFPAWNPTDESDQSRAHRINVTAALFAGPGEVERFADRLLQERGFTVAARLKPWDEAALDRYIAALQAPDWVQQTGAVLVAQWRGDSSVDGGTLAANEVIDQASALPGDVARFLVQAARNLGDGDADYLGSVATQVAGFLADEATKLAALNPELLNADTSEVPSALASAVGDSWARYRRLVEGVTADLSSLDLPASLGMSAGMAEALDAAKDQALAAVANLAQRPAVTLAAASDPFGANAGDIDAYVPPTLRIGAGEARTMALHLPYAAGHGGQRVKVAFEGADVQSFRVRGSGDSPDAVTELELWIPEGSRSVQFDLVSAAANDVDAQIHLSATLLDDGGTPTHVAQDSGIVDIDLDLFEPPSGLTTLTKDDDFVKREDFTGTVDLGEGDDFVTSASVDNRLIGGAGADILLDPEGGRDRIYAMAEMDLFEFVAQQATGEGIALRGDWITAGAGDDTISGSNANDALFGGADSDFIAGGRGDDVIDGDFNLWVTPRSDEWIALLDGANLFEWRFSGIELASSTILDGGAGDVIFAGAGADKVAGMFGIDTIYGESGDDILSGGQEGDMIYGGDGADRITGEMNQFDDEPFGSPGVAGDDYLDGGNGGDWLQGEWGDDRLVGGAGNDVIYGDAADVLRFTVRGDDRLDGGAGLDYLVGGPGSDILLGGDGEDELFGDSDDTASDAQGDDRLEGGPGDDYLRGYGGADTLFGGEGADQLLGEAGDDYLDGEAGDDVALGGEGADIIYGGSGDDRLAGEAGVDLVDGERGADLVTGGAGDDVLYGGAGGDSLLGGEGDDFLDGESGDDTLGGESGDDEIHGGSGIDQLSGGDGSDRLFGDEGADTLDGGEGDDVMSGGFGDDLMAGGAGNDILRGDEGQDELQGGDGDDVLEGGSGADLMSGGAGRDRFIVEGNDTLLDATDEDEVVLPSEVSAGDLVPIKTRQNGADVLSLQVIGETLFSVANVNSDVRMVDAAGTGLSLSEHLGAVYRESTVQDGSFGDDVLAGFADADLLRGQSGDDRLSGYSGEDAIEGGRGDDVLIGGTGADALYGDAGDDEYVFALGDGIDRMDDRGGGFDTVRFAGNVAPASIVPSRMANGDLIVRYGQNDVVTISGQFVDPSRRIERIVTSDGTAWTEADLLALPVAPIEGTGGDDVLVGTSFDEVLEGGAGDDVLDGRGGVDTLRGGAGRDTYRLSWGQGQDRIEDPGNGPEGIRLDATVTLDDLTVRRAGDDLVIALGAADSLQLVGAASENDRWAVTDAQGDSRTVGELLAATTALSTDVLAASRQGWLVGLKAAWFANWSAQGFEFTGAGTMGREPLSVGVSEAVTNVTSITFRMPSGEITGESMRALSDGAVERLVVDRDLRALTTVMLDSDEDRIDVALVPVSLPLRYDQTLVREIDRSYQYVGSGPSFTNVFDPTPDDPNDPFFFTSSSQTFVRYGHTYAVGVGTTVVARANREMHYRIPFVEAGEGANRIEYAGPGLIDAGPGDDIVLPMAPLKEFTLTASQYVPRLGGMGAWLSGGPGNDRLVGTSDADTLAGGDGDDRLEGGQGGDRYLMLAADSGFDVIIEPATSVDPENASGLRGDFERWLARSGEAPRRSNTVFASDDEQVLRSGLVARDVIALQAGIASTGISWSLDVVTSGEVAGQSMLDLAWSTDAGVQVLVGAEQDWRHDMPWDRPSSHLLGSGAGVERFLFADGSDLSLTEVRRRVLNTASDIVLARGDGNVTIDDLGVSRRLRFGPDIFPRDLVVRRDGRDALLALVDGTDSWRIADWFGVNGTVNVASIRFHDTGYWEPGRVSAKLLDAEGSGGSDTLQGVDGFDTTLSGLGGDDAIIAGDGDDVLSGGEGDDSLEGDSKLLVPLIVRARGSSAQNVDAKMEVRVDGALIGTVDVAANSGFTPYRFDLAWSRATEHRVDVAFVNDAWFPEIKQDRNLFVESIDIGGTRFGSNGTGVRYDRGAGAAAYDGIDVLAGQVVMPWNGALRIDIPDSWFGAAGDDLLDGGPGADRMEGGAGDDTYIIDDPADRVVESPGAGWDRMFVTTEFQMPDGVEALYLDGTAHEARGSGRDDLLAGNWGDDTLVGARGHDILQGGGGNDRLLGEGAIASELVVRAMGSNAKGIPARMTVRIDGVSARTFDVDAAGYRDYRLSIVADDAAPHAIDVAFVNDAWFPEIGEDRNLFVDSVTFGGALKAANAQSATYDRGAGMRAYDGVDVLVGQSVMPWNGALRFVFAESAALNDLLDGGLGDDVLEGGAGNDFLAGGQGSDLSIVDRGTDIVAFNRGDGDDRISVTGRGAIHVSLGNGIQRDELRFRRTGEDLVVDTGAAGDRLTFAEWFRGETRAGGQQFQFINSRTNGNGSTEAIVERYDFATVIAQVHATQDADAAVAGQWEQARVAMDALSGGDAAEVLGGDLAVHYGLMGSFSGLSVDTAQAALRSSAFGVAPQAFRQPEAVAQGIRTLV